MKLAQQLMGSVPQQDPTALAKKTDKNQDPEAIREVAKQFESIFMHQVFKSMRSTLPKDGMMSGGFGEEVFTDMLDQEYAKLSIANQSMGLADTIAAQLGGNSSPLDGALAPEALRKLKASHAYADQKNKGQWTAPFDGKVSQGFGMHRQMTETRAQFFDSVRYAPDKSGRVSAISDGEVTKIVHFGNQMSRVDVTHPDGFTSSYEGLSNLNIAEGERVERGQTLGAYHAENNLGTDGLKVTVQHRGRSIDPVRLWTNH